MDFYYYLLVWCLAALFVCQARLGRACGLGVFGWPTIKYGLSLPSCRLLAGWLFIDQTGQVIDEAGVTSIHRHRVTSLVSSRVKGTSEQSTHVCTTTRRTIREPREGIRIALAIGHNAGNDGQAIQKGQFYC